MAFNFPSLPDSDKPSSKPVGLFGKLGNIIGSVNKTLKEFKTQTGKFAPETKLGIAENTLLGLPQATRTVAKEIAQGTARSVTGIIAPSLKPDSALDFKKKIEPKGPLQTAIYGSKPFSIETEGQDLLDVFGMKDSKLAIPVGLFMGTLDILPGGGGVKKAATEVVETLPDFFKASLKAAKTEDEVLNVLKAEGSPLKQLSPQTITRLAAETEDEVIKNLIKNDVEKQLSRIQKINNREIVLDELDVPTTKVGKSTIGQVKVATSQLIPETTALKNKFQFAERISEITARSTKMDIKEFQTEVIKVLRSEIPKEFRFKYLSDLKNTQTKKQAVTLLDKITSDVEDLAKIEYENKVRSSVRSKIAYVKKIGEMSPIVQRDVKAQLGIASDFNKMTTEEYTRVYDELKNRLKEMKPGTKIDTKVTPDEYLEAEMNVDTTKSSFIDKTKEMGAELGLKLDEYLGVVSTRLERIAPEFKATVRKFMNESILRKQERISNLTKVFGDKGKLYKAIPDGKKNAIKLALNNGDFDVAEGIFKDHGIDFGPIRQMLDDTLEDAKMVKAVDPKDFKEIENYFPRVVDDFNGLMKHLDKDTKSFLEEAFASRSAKLGRPLNDAEKGKIADTLLRGFKLEGATVSNPGAFKQRTIQKVTPDMLKFYKDPMDALLVYIDDVTEKIEWNRMVGKVDEDLVGPYTPESTIGSIANKLIEEGKLPDEKAQELKNILNAISRSVGENSIVSTYKNLEYAALLGSPLNAIANIQDLTTSLYKNGLKNTFGAGIDKLINKSDIDVKSLGISDQVAGELTDVTGLNKQVRNLFKRVGFSFLDNLASDVFLKSSLTKAQKLANKPTPEFLSKLSTYFGKDAGQVLTDLKLGNTSWDVKHYLLNELADFKPISKLEVPEKYLKAGGWRIAYMLKTWGLKQVDIIRREAYNEIADGIKNGDAAQVTKGMVNLAKYATIFTMTGMAKDKIQEFIKGEEFDMTESAMDNLVQMSGLFNRYTMNSAWQKGDLKSIAASMLPPMKIAGNAFKDFTKAYRSIFQDGAADFNINEASSIRSIPYGGELYYWWFGKHTKPETGGLPGLPELPSLPELPALPDLPELPAI